MKMGIAWFHLIIDINTRTGPPFSATSAFFVNQHYWIVGPPPPPAPGKYRATPASAGYDATYDKKESPNAGSRAIEGSGENFLSNALPQPGWLMRILGAIVLPLVLAMIDTRQRLSLRRAIAPQLVRDEHTRDIAQAH